MPDKELAFWAAVGAGLAAIGSSIRYCIPNAVKKTRLEWWRDGAIDLLGSVTLSVVVFLGATQVVNEVAAAGAAGMVGHLGVRETILLIRRLTKRKK